MALTPYVNPRRTTPRKASTSQSHQVYAFPAPLRGLDVTQPLPGGDPLTSIICQNLIPRVLGLELRKGYSRWVSNMALEIRSLISYHSPVVAPKLFAANAAGDVFDVTTELPSTTTPASVLSVPAGLPPGEWTSLNFTTSVGAHVLVLTCPGAGYYLYDGVAFVQVLEGTTPGTVEGVNPALFSYVTVYKNRLWFVEKDTTSAWYLPTGQFAGKATRFDFGSMFPNGGQLDLLVNWTYDGGTGAGTGGGGLSNKLVVIADQGDVLVYGGDDPDTAATFGIEGRWYIGRVPAGTRYAALFQTDVVVLSERGLNFMSELMRGQGFFGNESAGSNINSALATQVSASLNSRYWEVKFLPHEQLLVINFPEANGLSQQWAYEVNNKAFCVLAGMPMVTVESFDGRTFFGDSQGNVWLGFFGESDGAVDGVPGGALEGSLITAFSPMGEGARVKRFLMCRASFIAKSAPGVQVRLNREWSLGLPAGAPVFLGVSGSLWDTALWDQAVWTGEGNTYEVWTGATGTGRYAALALRVRGPAGLIFVGWQALVEPGGIL